MKYAYYPGCSLESTAREYDLSVRAVCQALDIELEELPDWNCCGASSGYSINYRLSRALPARNLAIAEKQGLSIAVACPACFLRLKATKHEFETKATVRQELSELLNLPYEAKYDVRHILDIICNEVGLSAVKDRVRKNLSGIKVVSYYGCYLVRPPKITNFDDPENPHSLDNLMDVLGAEALDWGGKVDCCGGNLSLTKKHIASKLVRDIVEAALEVGAEALVTACPLCQSNLEMGQSRSSRLPVFYFTELLGLALGLDAAHTWFKKHLISPSALLNSLSLV